MVKTSEDLATDFYLKDVYNEFVEQFGSISYTKFADILGTSKQNVSMKLNSNSKLLVKERNNLLKYLEEFDYTYKDLYKKLQQTKNIDFFKIWQALTGDTNSSNSSMNEKMDAYFKQREELYNQFLKGMSDIYNKDKEEDSDFVKIPVRGDVSLSCGYGTEVYNDNVTATCNVPKDLLRKYGASTSSTEIVYALGDSMSPEIESGDALLVDVSQRDIVNGLVYAFNYESQPMCKRLQKLDNKIKAISKNTLYDPFIIDETNQFNIVGRVVGIMRQIR